MPFWDGTGLAAPYMMVVSSRISPVSGTSPIAGGSGRTQHNSASQKPQPPLENSPQLRNSGTLENKSAVLRPDRSDGHNTAHAIRQGRLPQSAFAAQMIDQWSSAGDEGLYLVRARSYEAEAGRMASQPKVDT